VFVGLTDDQANDSAYESYPSTGWEPELELELGLLSSSRLPRCRTVYPQGFKGRTQDRHSVIYEVGNSNVRFESSLCPRGTCKLIGISKNIKNQAQ